MVITRDLGPRNNRDPSPTGSVASGGSFGRGRGNLTIPIHPSTSSPSIESRVTQMEESIRGLSQMMSTMMRRLEEGLAPNQSSNQLRDERNNPTVPNLENPLSFPPNNSGHRDRQNESSQTEEIDLPSDGFSVRGRYSQAYKPIPVKDWGIVFSGDSKGMKVNTFLRDMEKMARTQRVPVDSTLSAMHLCLSGDALTWYRSCELFTQWSEFSRALSATFGRLDGDLSVRRRLEERRQRDGERVGVFLAEIYSLFRELEVPMDTRSQIQLIRRNLTPQIRDAILFMNFHSLQELEKAIITVESNSLLAAPEPRSRNARVNEMEEVAAISNPSNSRNTQPYRKTNPSKNPRTQNTRNDSPTSSPRYPLCVNCFLGNHLVRDCTQPMRASILCFGCGRENTIREHCPNCRNSGGDGSGP